MPVRYIASVPANCCKILIPEASARRIQSCNTRPAVRLSGCPRAIASDSTRIIGSRLILSRDRAYHSLRNGQVLSFTEQYHAHPVPGNQEALSQSEGPTEAA